MSRSGVGFTGLLTILFIGLRLDHVITWPWWEVLAPIWIYTALLLLLVLGGLVLAVGALYLEHRRDKRPYYTKWKGPR